MRDPLDRFADYIDFDGPDGCWDWTGNRAGEYGRTTLAGKQTVAHRAVYEVAVEPIPHGLQIDHLCRRPICVNPDHLEPVTGLENMRRWSEAKTHCKRGHEFTPDNTLIVHHGKSRQCRTCRNAAYRRYDIKRGKIMEPVDVCS